MKRKRNLFIIHLAREYPHIPADQLVVILEALLRRAKHYQRLMLEPTKAQERTLSANHAHEVERCRKDIHRLCQRLPECQPIFSSDPRGATVKLLLPSGVTDSMTQVGLCVPVQGRIEP